jgi:general secretion pathway protein E
VNLARDLAPGDDALTAARIEEARMQARPANRRVIEVLEENLGLAPAEFMAALAAALRFPLASIQKLHELAPAFDLLPFSEASAHECIAFRDANGGVQLMIGDPFALDLQAWALERLATPFVFCLAHREDIAAYLARVEDDMRAMDGVVAREEGGAVLWGDVEDLSLKTIGENLSPVIRLVNSTLYDALKIGASDIHLESAGSSLAIKYRIDGVLSQVGRAQGAEMAEQAISRVKVMAELDIAERRVPQDGRFKVRDQGREVDFRVSIMPSVFGEDAVLRILDKQALVGRVLTA